MHNTLGDNPDLFNFAVVRVTGVILRVFLDSNGAEGEVVGIINSHGTRVVITFLLVDIIRLAVCKDR